MTEITIEGPVLGRAAVCEPILRALPEWFGIEEALAQFVEDIEIRPTFLAVDEGANESAGSGAGERVVGFLTVSRHNPHSAEVHVMGVRRERRGEGIGAALLRAVEAWLAADEVEFLQVKTLGPSRPNESYAQTRAFYVAMGFRPLEELRTLWNEANPCLIMVKRLGS